MITYSEPKKETFKTVVIKYDGNKTPEALEFNSIHAAWKFLKEINIYINDKKVHSYSQ